MKKTVTVILAVITALTLIVNIVTQNAELWNIPLEYITIASSIILAIKQFIEQSGLLTPEEAAQFANHENDNKVYQKGGVRFTTAQDVKDWKSNK